MTPQLSQLLRPDTVPPLKEVAEMAARYPYMMAPQANLLRQTHNLPAEMRRRFGANVMLGLQLTPDLHDILGPDAEALRFYPPEQRPAPTTDSTIDTFLQKYCHTDSKETDALTRMIFSPVPDYAAQLAAEADAPRPTLPAADRQSELIDRFIEQSDKPAVSEKSENSTLPTPSSPTQSSTPPTPSSTLTLSLAQIMIKKGNYAKALQIITELSLANPQKSTIFAAQIRFLRKLIANQA